MSQDVQMGFGRDTPLATTNAHWGLCHILKGKLVHVAVVGICAYLKDNCWPTFTLHPVTAYQPDPTRVDALFPPKTPGSPTSKWPAAIIANNQCVSAMASSPGHRSCKRTWCMSCLLSQTPPCNTACMRLAPSCPQTAGFGWGTIHHDWASCRTRSTAHKGGPLRALLIEPLAP